MSSFPNLIGGGGSLNVPDDHRFGTTEERDDAIPTPEEGEQCTIESSIPQYHLLQEYRTDEWVDITYLIEGPPGADGDPTQLIDDENVSEDKTFSSSKIDNDIRENGFKDNGLYSQFEDSFKNLPKGMSYIYGYSEETGLPVLSNDNPIFVNFGEFAGYDYNVFCLLGSHDDDEGLWAYIENAGTEGKWFKLGCPDDADKLDAITDTGSGKIITDDERQMLGDFAFTDQIMKDNGIIRGIDEDYQNVIEKGVTTLLGGWDDVSQLPDLEVKEASFVSFGVIGGGGNRLYILCNNHDGYYLSSKDGGYERQWSKIVESSYGNELGTVPRNIGELKIAWTKEAMFSTEEPEALGTQEVIDAAISGLNLRPSKYVKVVESPIGSILVLDADIIEQEISSKYTQGEVLSMSGKKITDVGDCSDDNDVANKRVVEETVENSFKLANNPVLDAQQYIVDFRDLTKSSGYGKDNLITYEGVNDNTLVQPDKSLGSLFFLHEKIDSTVGFLMVHESVLGDLVDSSTNSIPCVFTGQKAALGKSNQRSTDLLDSDAIWNCLGRGISNTDDANSLPPPNLYYDKEGTPGGTSDPDKAFTATYSYGSSAIVGERELRRGYVRNVDNNSAYFESHESSEFFIIRVTAGGGTFNVKKLFQYFPKEYLDTVYSTSDFSIAFGLKVTDNRRRILALEESEDDEVTPVEQEPDSNGVVETIRLKSRVQSFSSLNSGENKVLDIGYLAEQVRLVSLSVTISAATTDTSSDDYGKVSHIEGVLFKKDGSFSFMKRSVSGDELNLGIVATMNGGSLSINLSDASCDLNITAEAIVRR